MHTSSNVTLTAILLLFCLTSVAQVSNTADSTQALLQRSFAALSAAEPTEDVTLSGVARRIAGSDDETGTVILQAVVTGESRMEMSFGSGKFTEIRSYTPKGQAGKWIGTDGVTHKMAAHNLLVDDSLWFSPTLALRKLKASADTVASRTEVDGPYLAISLHISNSGPLQEAAKLVEKASEMRIYFDSATSLPTKINYNTHPDNDLKVDLPVEVRFSDYRTVNGAKVPFHIEKYLNGGLILDMHLQTASINTGISPSSITQ